MTTSHAAPRPPDACSVEWDDAALPAWGSASYARFWVCLEQNGPWGHSAITESHLDHDLGMTLERACADHSGRLLLIRRSGRHDETAHHGPHTVLIAGCLDRDPWLLTGEIDDPAQLLSLPWDDLLADDPDAVTERLPELEETRDPALLICTNGKRDVCCAVRGRPLALDLAGDHPDAVWECSHTGGHRFAPTGIALPSGHTYARLTTQLAALALQAERRREVPAGLATEAHDRGRSCFKPPVQVAESLVRQHISELHGAALTAVGSQEPDGGWQCTVSHTDGRSWTVDVTAEDGPELKSSCAKAPSPSTVWRAALTG
ncbi:sucrase ferredoxin [Flexivirga caeni]|uniref:Sucrase ferredoxin n=1 Tax=Flexivirga caeni TaxID=2294115 RepID=A0A3M9MHX5_9MICO|nr:sucrase ferredoxin [Flexivirga caeni]RNI24443.1 sucrase ferredoxin [Flexivirga caeni]